MERQLISEEDTALWLSRGDLKGETESEIIAAQGQALQTKYNATKILQTESDRKCRICKQFDEIVEHVISACPMLAKEQYIKDMIECAQIHVNICTEIRVKLDNEHWYYCMSKSVDTSPEGKVTILRSTSANWQDLS